MTSLRDVALATARRVASEAEPSGGGRSWHADTVVGVDGDRPLIGPGDVGPTLYDGAAGIGLALAACAAASAPGDDGALARAARGAAAHALAAAPELLEEGRLGLFDGATGIALGAQHAGRLLGDRGLMEGGLSLARTIAARLEEASGWSELDVIGGRAGAMLGLQMTLRAAGEPPPVAAIMASAAALSGAAQPQTWGAAWPPPDGRTPPLLGLGHGAAGIALALAETSALTGDPAAARACAQALEYERGWFDGDRVAWPDLRDHDECGEPTGWMAAWCHGAIGIGLARLRTAQLTGDALAVMEASAALQAARDLVVAAGTALREGRLTDCSACHGLSGVVELLLVAADTLGVADHARAARRVAGLLVEQRDAAGGAWPCGLPGAGEIPGLMTGRAGIALTLLRAAGAAPLGVPLLPGPAST